MLSSGSASPFNEGLREEQSAPAAAPLAVASVKAAQASLAIGSSEESFESVESFPKSSPRYDANVERKDAAMPGNAGEVHAGGATSGDRKFDQLGVETTAGAAKKAQDTQDNPLHTKPRAKTQARRNPRRKNVRNPMARANQQAKDAHAQSTAAPEAPLQPGSAAAADGFASPHHNPRESRGNSTIHEDDSRKVFVGNLEAGITETDLKRHFEQAGNVEYCKLFVNYRGMIRPYAFVTFGTEAEKERAAKELDKSKINNGSQEISVQVVEPRSRPRFVRRYGRFRRQPRKAQGEEGSEAPVRRGRFSRRKNDLRASEAAGSLGAENVEGSANVSSTGESDNAEHSANRPKRRFDRFKRKRSVHAGDASEAGAGEDASSKRNEVTAADSASNANESGNESSARGRNSGRRGRQFRQGRPRRFSRQPMSAEGEAAEGDVQEEDDERPRVNPRRTRMPRQPRGPMVAMPTSVYVANLECATSNEELGDFFKNHNFNVVSSYVIKSNKRPFFGFVEFATSEEQERAIQQLHGVEFRGRNMVIRIAKKSVSTHSNEDGANAEVEHEATNSPMNVA